MEDVLTLLEDSLIDGLYRHGHILYRNVPVIESNKEFKALLDCVEIDSLDAKNRKYYVNKNWQEIEKLANNKIVIKHIGNEYVENSKCCGKQSFFILYLGSPYSPIRCGDCFEPVSIYSIPETYHDGKGYDDIFFWRKNYQACYDLWALSYVGEKYHQSQLSKHDSKLTQMGLQVCKNIEKVTNKSVYYFLMNYDKVTPKKDKKRKCPVCNGDWIVDTKLHETFDFKCDKCKLLSELSSNSG